MLIRLYLQNPDAHFFGDSVPVELQSIHVPVKVRIAPPYGWTATLDMC